MKQITDTDMTTNETAPMQIRIAIPTDWGCDHTPEYADAYEDAITERISADYPGADLKIEWYLGPGRIWVFNCPPGTTERDVEEKLGRILQKVWDEGEFWQRVR